MAGMLGMQTAESILKDRQEATRKNTMGILAQAKRGKNTEEQIGVDIGSILANLALGAFTEGDASKLNAVRESEATTGNIQQSIAGIESTVVPTSAYLGSKGQASPEMLQSLADSQALTQKSIGMLPQDMQNAVHGESYREGITRDMLSNPNAMAEHAYKNKQYADAMKFTNVGLAQTQAKEKDRMSYIRAQVSSGLVTGEAAAKQYDEIMSMGQAPAEGAAINDTRASTNNANFKSPEELLGGGKNNPEEENFLVKMAKDYAGNVEADDEQVANYVKKNNIKGVRSKQDLEAIRTKATDELNQDITKKRSNKTSYNSFNKWLQENL